MRMARGMAGWSWMVFWMGSLTAAPLVASGGVLYDKDGIRLEGTVLVSTRNAATCNVLEEKHTPEEYERLKANQGQPLHVWRLDLSIHNNSGKAVEFLRADFEIDSPHPPCTNWSGEGPGGGAIGDRIDVEGRPRPLEWAVPFKVVSTPYGMAPGEVVRETLFLLVFHSQEPVLKGWEVDYTFARTSSRAPSAQQAGEDPPRAARRPRIQLPPTSWPTSTCARRNSWWVRRTMRKPGRPWRNCWSCRRSTGWNPLPQTITATRGSGRRRESQSGSWKRRCVTCSWGVGRRNTTRGLWI